MQLRVSRTTRNGRTYEYAQLVESVRRDGMPTHRVVASLGALSALEIENLRAALMASRQNKPVQVALPTELSGLLKPSGIAANEDVHHVGVRRIGHHFDFRKSR